MIRMKKFKESCRIWRNKRCREEHSSIIYLLETSYSSRRNTILMRQCIFEEKKGKTEELDQEEFCGGTMKRN